MKNIYITTNKNGAILFSKDMVKEFKKYLPNTEFILAENLKDAFEKTKPENSRKTSVYAVKSGLVKGIFHDVCYYDRFSRNIKGSQAKKCGNIEEAYKYLYKKEKSEKIETLTEMTMEELMIANENIAFVDGSFKEKGKIMGTAYCIQCGEKVFSHSSFVKCGNGSSCIAELMSAMLTVDRAISEGLKDLTIVYDNMQIRNAYLKQPKEHSYSRKYYDYMHSVRKQINLNFVKVKAHSGNEKNNYVDRMARSKNISKFLP